MPPESDNAVRNRQNIMIELMESGFLKVSQRDNPKKPRLICLLFLSNEKIISYGSGSLKYQK